MAPFTKAEFIWMNGALVRWDAAQIHTEGISIVPA